MLDQVPQKIKYAADAASWSVVLLGWFAAWSPVITGVAGILAALWTGAQFYDWCRKKITALKAHGKRKCKKRR